MKLVSISAGLCLWAVAAGAGTFGTVVPIGGHAADLALDERRGVVYLANFTAQRIDVVPVAGGAVQSSINVTWQPGSIALSRDGRYLAVTHFWNFEPPAPNPVTVVDLDGNVRRTVVLGVLPLAVAFGADNRALILTAKDFRLLDPVSGTVQILDTIEAVGKKLPVPLVSFPPQIVQATMAVSGDGQVIYGLAEAAGGRVLQFGYDVAAGQVSARNLTTVPPFGPRVVSVNHDGSAWLAAWGLFDARGVLMAQFRNATGAYALGTHAIDSARGVVYAQIPTQVEGAAAAPPLLGILDADNLALRERIRLPENLAGKAVLDSKGDVLYAVSDSGLMILPVGALDKQPRVAARQEALVFRGNFCERGALTQELEVADPGGGRTDFRVSVSAPGVTVSPASGVTPARVRVTVDLIAYQNRRGTATADIEIRSVAAVNLPPPVRLLVNNREPDHRCAFYNVHGKLVDLLADPARDRFYVLRQDKNQVLVFDGSTFSQIATLRTGNTPTGMAITLDAAYLLVGNDDSQIANVFDLNRLQPTEPIVFQPGHYPRSIAASGGAILAASRVAGPAHTIDRVNLYTRNALPLPSLGIYDNNININTVLVGTPSGSSILAAMADGRLLLYNASADTFTISRKDFPALAGPYAAASNEQFLVDKYLLNPSLVPLRQFDIDAGTASGFAFVDQYGVRTSAPSAPAPGVIERIDIERAQSVRPTGMSEAPLVGETGAVLTRTLAPLANRRSMVVLTTSGFSVCPWNYDEAGPAPRLARVLSAADGSGALAPGALVRIVGADLGAAVAAQGLPLPTALAESCLTVNGRLVPMLAVSSGEIKAQLPFEIAGNVAMLLRTPSGASNTLNLTLPAAAPSVFRSGAAGPLTGLATVIRASNGEFVTLSNPVHRGDALVIYGTGLGRTDPAVEAGLAAPADPLASALIPPQVELGGVALHVLFAGLTPGHAGVYQINATVPGWAPLGMSVPLTIRQAGQSTTLEVRVVE
ncbi:MAG: hypothetical protein AAB225_25725 [Acidobacteriota bacterium]